MNHFIFRLIIRLNLRILLLLEFKNYKDKLVMILLSNNKNIKNIKLIKILTYLRTILKIKTKRIMKFLSENQAPLKGVGVLFKDLFLKNPKSKDKV